MQLKANYNINNFFVDEKNKLQNIIYEEISLLEKKDSIRNKKRLELLKDALFVIEKGFEDLMLECENYSFQEKKNKVILFRESLMFSLYEN